MFQYVEGNKSMTVDEFKKNFVNHYLLLEKDFQLTTEYVTLSKDNYDTYSVSYLKLLLTIGSEIDVMLEFLAKLYDPATKEMGFGCSKILLKNEPDIKSLEIKLRNEELLIKPWDCEMIPEWWTAYNEIKHNRYEDAIKFDSSRKYYQYANLRNVINALAALLSLELYAYRIISIQNSEKLFVPNVRSIFTVQNLYWKDIGFGSGIIVIDGCLYMND